MRLLGIDPGIARMGWGVVELDSSGTITYIGGGVFETAADSLKVDRIYKLLRSLEKTIKQFEISGVGMENIFFSKNVKTAITVGECRGLIYALCGKYKLPLYEFTPNEIKQSLTSYGNASKAQVQKMIQTILNIDFLPTPDDFADALGIAYCTAIKFELKDRLE
ncbi:crossover junction endodeoxyribonuclease RuvC [Candidatus Dojkabacteria bacterium]|nr:crossover junction endodeoxyribonuclease RuvC [Candidatus Dojkabacteria bacterium]